MALAIALHLLAAVLWVGGMFFAWWVLRPVAAGQLEPPARLRLWQGVFRRFFPWVWAAVAVLLVTGFWMLFAVFGGMGGAGWHVHLMLLTGLAMMAIFLHLWFAPYPRLGRAIDAEDWPAGGQALGQIRRLIGVNLIIGLITVAVASGGRFL
jgi:uncharacterized membrane protein